MADLLSAISSLSSSLDSSSASTSSSQTASDMLVASYKATQQSSLDALKQKQSSLELSRTFYNTLKTKISSLVSQLDIFKADNAASKFITRSITSSDSSYLTATASSSAVVGLNSIKVNRLATNDVLMSDQMATATAFGVSAGAKSFSINVNGNTRSYNVTLDGTETNEQAMKKVVDAINLDKDADVTASYLKDTSSTARLTFTSKKTGGVNDISFSEVLSPANKDQRLLGHFGFVAGTLKPDTTSRVVATSTTAGYKTADYNTLDSQLDVNGISVTRSSNSIDDILPGVTLNLLKPQDASAQALTITTSVNTDAVTSLINPLLDSYNDLIRYFKSNNTQLRKDPAASSLYSKLRATVTKPVASVNSGNPKLLTDIGIKIGSDGTLSIGDKSKLEGFLKDDPSKVSALFTSSDGFANKLNDVVSNLLGNSGLIYAKTTSLNNQIDSTAKRYSDMEAKIDNRAEAMRKEYESMLQTYMDAQNQYTFLSGFPSTSSGTQY